MLDGFKKFILRGNVVDMAVGVVIGAAFGGVVAALTKDLLTPLIAALVGKPDFSNVAFTLHGTLFPVGDFINACISFLLIAAAIYFAGGAHASRREAGGSDDEAMSRVLERDSDRGAAVFALHAASDGAGGIEPAFVFGMAAQLTYSVNMGYGFPLYSPDFYTSSDRAGDGCAYGAGASADFLIFQTY